MQQNFNPADLFIVIPFLHQVTFYPWRAYRSPLRHLLPLAKGGGSTSSSSSLPSLGKGGRPNLLLSPSHHRRHTGLGLPSYTRGGPLDRPAPLPNLAAFWENAVPTAPNRDRRLTCGPPDRTLRTTKIKTPLDLIENPTTMN